MSRYVYLQTDTIFTTVSVPHLALFSSYYESNYRDLNLYIINLLFIPLSFIQVYQE